ncbi:unnamed protein product [Closterium sp. Yama58-4]|nr:unnamed protein product [Closterium sp. Yama58-4]
MPNGASVAGVSLGAGGRVGRVVGEGMPRQQGGGVGIGEEERGGEGAGASREGAGASGVVARGLDPGPGLTTAAMGWRGGASGTLAQAWHFPFKMALFTHYLPCNLGLPRSHVTCDSLAVGPPTCACTLYEDASAYLLLVSLPHCDLSCLRVTWRNDGAAGIVKISCAAIFPPSSVSHSGRTFRQVSRSHWLGEHCPVGPFEREVQLPQRIPENADVAASVSADG